ncbi:AfsR/SARP family transcriptional regulator [Streptomyces aureoverticillatus]|uniref:AfsR/SARP family transcriptional regulator n=1 Tax=Streptomyces aureoverticillatus TaxID=66871 RepID=UPI0013DB6E5F|nr:AfsR/SARP family transcriptional regulator [Streptomyces aureoverticillatus]QIB44183.1 AfsR family transcriptional regulator [Streptomyces aureoverticillatus]
MHTHTHTQPRNLTFRLLGPVEAHRDGVRLGLGSPQQRAVLAMLLLHEGRPVGAEELVDGVWGEQAPRRALGAIRTYVSRLRGVLEPGRAARGTDGVLVSVGGGYALPLPDDSVDSVCFERAVAARGGGPREAHERLSRALGRWSGSALAGVPGPYAQRQRDRLAEVRTTTLEALHTYALDLGLHARSVPELTALAVEFPLRERLRALLMLALYRSGRQADALAVYADTRRGLRDELGITPGPHLTALHQAILTGDPQLAYAADEPRPPSPPYQAGNDSSYRAEATGTSTTASTATTAHATAPAPARPRTPAAPLPARPAHPARSARPQQLPTDTADFTGRTHVVDELGAVLRGGGHGDGARTVTVATLIGTGGVGKTTVAVHVAHALRADFPDGRLHVDLGAGSTPAEPASVLTDFLIALGTPSDRVPLELEQRAALFRTVLADRRVLLVLDNARDAEQVRPLLPGTAGCAVLVTSRARDLALAGAHRIDLDVPPERDALALLAAIAGPERVAAEPVAAHALVAACGRLPLAVRIIGSRLAARPGRTLASLDARLRDTHTLLDELNIGTLRVEPTFRLGYEALAPGPTRAFRTLSLLDAPDLPLPVAAALLGLAEHTAEALAEELVDAGMLESYGPGRYRFHDLLRLYARRQAERTESAEERRAALMRVLDLLLGSVVRAAEAAVRAPMPAIWLSPAHHPGLSFTDIDEVRAWFRTEHALLAAAVEQLLGSGPQFLRKSIDLLIIVATSGIFLGRAHYLEVARITGLAADRARAHGDDECEARALHTRAWLSVVVMRYAAAEADVRAALDCAARTGNPLRHHMSGVLLALTLRAMGRAAEADEAMRTAQRHAGDPEDPSSPASVASFVSRLHVTLSAEQPGLSVMTPMMRAVDATGASLTTDDGVARLGDELHRAAPLSDR